MSNAPFRADHVGSLLRPEGLLAALGCTYLQLDDTSLAYRTTWRSAPM